MVRTIFDPGKRTSEASVLDPGALVLFFPGPRSATGEDVLEFHVHGGRAVVQAVLSAISHAKGPESSRDIRYAEPGEFTRRAFLNGRLDLMQVEALGDTLAAVTEQQRRLSVRGTMSGLSRQYEVWRQQLLRARAELEALIDFSEDHHLDESPASLIYSVASQITRLRRYVRAYRDNAVRGELLRDGISLSLLGAPNVGKSSLMNLIVGREAAIVSKDEGTTRDVIEVGIDIGGWYCRLGDMAGLRGNNASHEALMTQRPDERSYVGEVEREGMRRAKKRALESDVLIVVLSIERSSSHEGLKIHLNPDVIETAANCSTQLRNVAVVINKMDQLPLGTSGIPEQWIQQVQECIPNLRRDWIFGISCKQAEDLKQDDAGHIQTFLKGLARIFKNITAPILLDGHHPSPDPVTGEFDHTPTTWEESIAATKRQRLLLDDCLLYLDEFLSHAGGSFLKINELQTQQPRPDMDVDLVVVAESLRAAADCLAKITGKGEAGDVEEVLGVVFEKYAITPVALG